MAKKRKQIKGLVRALATPAKKKKKRHHRGKYHGFYSRNSYLAFKAQWGKHRKKKHKKRAVKKHKKHAVKKHRKHAVKKHKKHRARRKSKIRIEKPHLIETKTGLALAPKKKFPLVSYEKEKARREKYPLPAPKKHEKPLAKKIPVKPEVLPKIEKRALPKKTAAELRDEKIMLEFETAKQLKEAASLIKEMKAATGAKEVFEKIKYVESLEDKIARLRDMNKNLEYEFLKRRITPEEYRKRRFEYMEALRFLSAQKKARNKAIAEGKISKDTQFGTEGLPGMQGSASVEQAFAAKAQRAIIDRLAKIEQKVSTQEMPEDEKSRWAETLGKIEQINKAVTKSPEAQKEITEKLEKLHKAVTRQKPKVVLKKPEKIAKLIRAAPKKIHTMPLPEKRPREIPIITMKTPVDKFMSLVREQKESSFESLANILNWSTESVERVGLVLEKKGLVDVHYPAIVTKKPFISFLKELPEETPPKVTGKIIEEYAFIVDHVPANVKIYEVAEEHRPVYQLITPRIGNYTKAFFEELTDSIAEQIPVEISEVTDVKKGKQLKNRFFFVAKQELRKYLTETPEQQINTMAGMLLHSMYGLGEIEMLMGDNQLEEIAVNSMKTPIAVYHKQRGWMKSTLLVSSEDEIFNYAAQIGRKIGREITTLNPILDAHLTSGDRVSATLSPISGFGNTITIRRFARRPWTVVDFVGASHTMNLEMAALMWLAMQYEMSVLVAGGTASGKTSALNALMAMIPSYHRTISIEDVREIMMPKYMHWNWIPLTTRNPNPEGKGGVTMLDLMQSSLRMRPDRIILGEIRRKKEAEVLFEAMHTGHSVYSTIHANSSSQVLRRLTEPPISLPPLEIEAIDLVLVQYRDRRRNIRRTYELSEIEAGASGQLSINTVFKWDPRDDAWESINPPTKLINQINMHTGMTEAEVKKDLKDREKILKWMLENNLHGIEDVGQAMKLFYSDADSLKNAAKKSIDPKSVLGDNV